MKRKKCLGLALAIVLILSAAAFASAEQSAPYALGDKMEDFSVTLSDGQELSLYGLLKEKKAVLINFWASWCNPCKMEFPYMQKAYDEMSDEIGIIALSCEKTDTDEIVLQLKKELGLGSLPMGLDNGLSERFGLDAYPTSVVVDRFGTICFREAGSITDKDKFIRLFSLFTAEDYEESAIVKEIPSAKPTVEYPPVEQLRAALSIQDDRIALRLPEDASAWPFVPSEDGSCLTAANGGSKDTEAVLEAEVTVEAGEALYYEYALSCAAVMDSLTLTVDDEMKKYYGGELDWSSDYLKFDTAGAHQVEIAFKHGANSTAEQTSAMLRGMCVLSADKVSALEAQKIEKPRTLEGTNCEIEPLAGSYREIIVTQYLPGSGESTEHMVIVPDGQITLRVKIGAEVDENLAFVASNTEATLLSNLPCDETGYLYDATVASAADDGYPNVSFMAFNSAISMDLASNSVTCFATEADVDAYIAMLQEMAMGAGIEDYELRWEYADGSPRESAPAAEAEEAADDGTAEYSFTVTDESGAPLAGAMLQICDEGSCQVVQTDAEGAAELVAARYPYEIHLLKAPEGYAPDTTTYTMPEEGGDLTIVLKKQ